MNLQISGLKVDAGGGPGSRGGNVIGKTSTGKPIYASHGHVGHKDFTSRKHEEAAKVHIRKRFLLSGEAHQQSKEPGKKVPQKILEKQEHHGTQIDLHQQSAKKK